MLPTSHLPPIQSASLANLQSSVDYLRVLYNPPVRGSLRRRTVDDSHPLHTDAFERDYAIRWLTALISWNSTQDPDIAPSHREHLLRSAVSLLASCAGSAAAGEISRTFVFDTNCERQPSSVVVVELVDAPLDNHDYGSVGAQTWGSACIMADMIAECPSSFGIPKDLTIPSRLRCLELGAGTGLVSLTIGKIILQHIPNSLSSGSFGFEVIATDRYPSVLTNLERNIQTNFSTCIGDDSPLRIRSYHLDWSLFPSSHPSTFQDLASDVVFGADIIYETQHALWVKLCLSKLLRKPSLESKDPTFHLIIPLRTTHVVESNTIEHVFKTQEIGRSDQTLLSPRELVIKHKEKIFCDSEKGSSEKVEYAYYRIGWGL